MYMNVDKDRLSKMYFSISDEQIEELILYELKDLTPEALSVLKIELGKRELSQDLQSILDAQIRTNEREVSTEEINALMRNIYKLPCPICGENKNFINAAETMIVKSFLIFTSHRKFLLFGCSDCIATAAKSSLIKSLFMGWWGFPWGLIKTPEAIFLNLNAMKCKEPTKIFIKLIKDNASFIKANANDRERLNQLLLDHKFVNSKVYDLEQMQYYSEIGKKTSDGGQSR